MENSSSLRTKENLWGQDNHLQKRSMSKHQKWSAHSVHDNVDLMSVNHLFIIILDGTNCNWKINFSKVKFLLRANNIVGRQSFMYAESRNKTHCESFVWYQPKSSVECGWNEFYMEIWMELFRSIDLTKHISQEWWWSDL